MRGPTRQPKFIVLDANVFIADYWLRSPSFLLLREFLSTAKATLVVPKIVLEEVLNHHREEFNKLKSEIRNNVRDAGRLLRNTRGVAKWLMDISRNDSANPYERFLSEELATLKAEIPDYGDIPHIDIVKRDLRRRKPFQRSGKGYRDTLLWETIVRHYVASNVLTVFVTQNIRDFGGAEDRLHNDLLPDVHSAAKGKDGEIVLSRDLPAFTDAYIVPYLANRKDFALLVQHNKVSGLDLNEVCEEHIDALVKAVNESPSVMVDDNSYEPEVGSIYVPTEFQVKQASEVSTHILLVAFDFVAVVSFTYFIPHGEYYTRDSPPAPAEVHCTVNPQRPHVNPCAAPPPAARSSASMASEQFLVAGRFRFRLGTDNLICKHVIKVIRFWISRISGEMAPDEIVAEVDHLDSKTIFRIGKKHVIVSMPEPILVRRDKRMFGAHVLAQREMEKRRCPLV